MTYGLLLGLRALLGYTGFLGTVGPDIDDMLENLQEEVPVEIDEQTQLQHIRANLQALIMMIVLVALAALAIYLFNKRSVQKRYAAHQAQLASEGRLDRSNALSALANSGTKPRFINDDDGIGQSDGAERALDHVLGDNYNPYGKDGTGAIGE